MKSIRWDKLLLLGTTLSCTAPFALAQGFLNLDFESANLTSVPPGQFGGYVSISDALPGWNGYANTYQVTTVLQNSFTTGGGSLDIFGPDWNNFGAISIIEGSYTVALQPGGNNTPNALSATIAQTGLVPLTAHSLQLKAASLTTIQPVGTNLEVTLSGQTISMTPLLITGTYTLYGGNITPFSGQSHELRISALPAIFGISVDSIEFSPQIVPEPAIGSLLFAGGLLFSTLRRKQISR